VHGPWFGGLVWGFMGLWFGLLNRPLANVRRATKVGTVNNHASGNPVNKSNTPSLRRSQLDYSPVTPSPSEATEATIIAVIRTRTRTTRMRRMPRSTRRGHGSRGL
jgi:hypothetical protein